MAQETWVRAVERLDSFDFRSSLRTWLLGIALNCWRELSRREQRHGLHLVSDGTASSESGVDRGGASGMTVRPRGPLRLELVSALDQLPKGYREVVLLHDVEGLTHVEIAGLLGISAGTSKSQLSHARKALRGLLEAPKGGSAVAATDQGLRERFDD